jgi:hypothetical protein
MSLTELVLGDEKEIYRRRRSARGATLGAAILSRPAMPGSRIIAPLLAAGIPANRAGKLRSMGMAAAAVNER